MARPRVFISSTYFDLKHVRTDLEQFIIRMGYEPVLHEIGSVPYDKKQRLEDSCYDEISTCDIVVSLIGGRFGTASKTQPADGGSPGRISVSQRELLRALQDEKQVYVFVERSVWSEYATYRKNRTRKDILYAHVDDAQIFGFLDTIEQLPNDKPVLQFEHASDIVRLLQEQWAGLFQRLLQDHGKVTEAATLQEIKATADTLRQLVTFLSEERRDSSETVKEILLSNHPLFSHIRQLLSLKFPVLFRNTRDLAGFLAALDWNPVDPPEWDDPKVMEYVRSTDRNTQILKIARSLFDKEGRLRVGTAEEFSKSSVELETHEPGAPSEDDIPF